MKIHSTQNLNLIQDNQQLSTNILNRDFRIKHYSEQVSPQLSYLGAMEYSSSLSFRGNKGATSKDAKKIIEAIKKGVGEIKKEATPDSKKGDNILKSPFFNWILDVVDYETVVTASVAAFACAARAGTILALPTKTNKEDNDYAAGQAGASGIIGFLTAFILTAPFRAGSDYVMKHMKQNLSAKTLKRLYPHIDLASIEKDGKRLPIREWKDRAKNAFIDGMKECEKCPQIKNLADVSEKTFSELLKLDVDWASQKGKSFNDVVLKNGKKFYDEINPTKIGIRVKEEGFDEAQILLSDIDKSYAEALIKDARGTGSRWGELDINSMYDKDGVVKDFRQWKDTNGKQWKLDLDEVGVSSPFETATYSPRISGKKRFDEKDKVFKFVSYQENGVNGKLGTEIENDMVQADLANDGLFKLLTWGPDILFRVPVAAATVAIIPWVMKNIFHLQKSTPKQKTDKNVQVQADKTSNGVKKPAENENINDAKVSFKGKGGFSGIKDWFVRQFGERYGKKLIENEKVHNISREISKLPGDTTQHMSALGSLITSSVYVHQTLTKKDIDPDRRRTLAINQGLCFLVPTAAAYTVDKFIRNWVKRRGYRFSGLNQQEIDVAKLQGKDIAKIQKDTAKLGRRLKGIRTLASITVFTLIYRYATPVLITPLANMIGDRWNADIQKKKKLRAAEKALAEKGSVAA